MAAVAVRALLRRISPGIARLGYSFALRLPVRGWLFAVRVRPDASDRRFQRGECSTRRFPLLLVVSACPALRRRLRIGNQET